MRRYGRQTMSALTIKHDDRNLARDDAALVRH
jgi:hypothetical protein